MMVCYVKRLYLVTMLENRGCDMSDSSVFTLVFQASASADPLKVLGVRVFRYMRGDPCYSHFLSIYLKSQ